MIYLQLLQKRRINNLCQNKWKERVGEVRSRSGNSPFSPKIFMIFRTPRIFVGAIVRTFD